MTAPLQFSMSEVVFFPVQSNAVEVTLMFRLQTALDNFPEISVVTELKKDGETPAFKVRLSGKAYNKKTMKPYKMPNKVPQVRRDNILVNFTVLSVDVQQRAQCHYVGFSTQSFILWSTEATAPFPVMSTNA